MKRLACFLIVVLFLGSGNPTEGCIAIENYRKSLELNPGNANGREMLIKLGVEKSIQ